MPGRHSWKMLIPTSTAPPATGRPQQPILSQATSRQTLPESTWLSIHSPPCLAHLAVVQRERATPHGYGTSSSLWEAAHGGFGWHWPHRRASWHDYYYTSERGGLQLLFSGNLDFFSERNKTAHICTLSLQTKSLLFHEKDLHPIAGKIIWCYCKAFSYSPEEITLKEQKQGESHWFSSCWTPEYFFSPFFLFFTWGDPCKVALATWIFPQRCSGKAVEWSPFIIDEGFHLPTGIAARGSKSYRLWWIPRSRRWKAFH